MTRQKRMYLTRLARFLHATDAIETQHRVGAHYDAEFDGGEFSGPARYRAMARDMDRAAERILSIAPDAVPSPFELACEMAQQAGVLRSEHEILYNRAMFFGIRPQELDWLFDVRPTGHSTM